MVKFNNDWDELLANEFQKEYYLMLREVLKEEYRTRTIYPGMYDIFNALKLTAYNEVKVVITGQDPYINPGEAHGLAFSVLPTAKVPPSLQNIFLELQNDLGCSIPEHGCLISWAKQGVLLLNNVLTVERGKSRSHTGMGWERFTDAVLALINAKETPVVYLLWGKDAQTKGHFLNNTRHLVLTAPHPSPLAGGRFFGCRHFSRTNAFLENNGVSGINWQI
jgi:uracil-DNA glycosylase